MSRSQTLSSIIGDWAIVFPEAEGDGLVVCSEAKSNVFVVCLQAENYVFSLDEVKYFIDCFEERDDDFSRSIFFSTNRWRI